MGKDTKKDDRVTIRLPEELRQFESFGFKNISEYIKAALEEFNQKEAFEVIRTQEILESISDLITVMEAERDSGVQFSEEKEQHLEHLYNAAKPLAESKLMMGSPLNQVESPFEEDKGEKIYKFNWAL